MSHTCERAADYWVLKWGTTLVGFCAVLTLPSGTMKDAKRIHRLVILPDFQGMRIGTRFLEAICDIYLKQGKKVHIRTAHEKLGNHMAHSPLWRPTARCGKKGAISNGEINGKNQNMYIVDSERYSYEYVGADYATKKHLELVVDKLTNIDMREMRKMLVELKKENYITIVHSRVREETPLSILCKELGIRTELLYFNRHKKFEISKKNIGKDMLVSLLPNGKPKYKKVA